MNDIKQQLYNICNQRFEKDIAEIEAAIADRREAVANETKSSMGDKYETTREMLQQDINMNLERLRKIQHEYNVLKTIDSEVSTGQVCLGSLVRTTIGNYYIAVSGGKHKIGDELFYIISPLSPIGRELIGRSVGDTIIFNNKRYILKQII